MEVDPPSPPFQSHSFVCCDLDHGGPSTPAPECPFDAYCCLDEHCSPSACHDDCSQPCTDRCQDACQPCPDDCKDACLDACPDDCQDACEPCPSKCIEPCTLQDCKGACPDPHCMPCDDPTCAPAWCPPDCTIEEYIQRCTDAACGLPQVPLDPLALLLSQTPQFPNFDPLGTGFMDMSTVPTPMSTATPSAPVSTPVAVQSNHVCHWQNCHRSFSSMPLLLAHLAAEHLSVPGMETPMPAPQPTPAPVPVQPTVPMAAPSGDLFSCLWDDCFPFGQLNPEPVQAAPVCTHEDHQHPHPHPHPHTHAEGDKVLSPQTMLRHLLEEHLGVPTDLWEPHDAHAHVVLTHKHKPHQHPHPHPPHTATHPPYTAHDAHGHAHAHLPPGHHHHPVKLPPTPSPTPSTDPTPHICLWPGCTARQPFPSAAELMEHLSEEHVGRGKDSYRCHWDGCGGPEGRLFSSRQKVLRHLQSHTGHRPFVCKVCGQTFSESAPLAAHMRRHVDDKPFVCDYPGCGKAFAISSSLTIHRRTHNGDRPFVCPHCGKGFVEASNLTKHIRTHTGERPFACTHPGCMRRFSRPDQLKRHMSVHDGPAKRRAAIKASA